MELICLNIITQFNRERWGRGKVRVKQNRERQLRGLKGSGLETPSSREAQPQGCPHPQTPESRKPEWMRAVTGCEVAQVWLQICSSTAFG